MRILDRYLLRLIALPLIIGLAVFVVIMLSETTIKLGQALLGMRIPPLLIAKYFLYRLPRAVAWSLPVGILVGAAMVTTHISRNGEANAARAAGASLQRIWTPLLCVGALGCLVAFAIEEYVVPVANKHATDTYVRMANAQPVMGPRSEQVFRDKLGRLIYIGYMDEKTNRLDNVMIVTEYPAGGVGIITTARWAEVSQATWVLRDGVTMHFDPEGRQTGRPQTFEARPVKLRTALQDYYLDERSYAEMSTHQMRRRIALLETGGLDAQRWKVRLQFKYSMPVACLVFVLVAVPLGAKYAAHGSFTGIVISILVVFLYNGVRSWGLAFGLVGDLPAAVAAWAQNVIFGALGLWLVARAR